MKKAYMVSHGSYSDYRIFAVFDNEEEANKMVGLLNKKSRNNEFEVEEIPLLSKCEDYQPEPPVSTIRAEYDLKTKETIIDIELGEFANSKIAKNVYCYNPYSLNGIEYQTLVCKVVCRMPLTVNNFMKIEKVLGDKVAEAEYELAVTHKYDMESFAKQINKEKGK